jgi:hypothetical protein
MTRPLKRCTLAGYFIGLAVQEYRKGMTKQAAIALGCTGIAMEAYSPWVN